MESFRRIGFLRSDPLIRPIENWAEFLPAVLQQTVQHKSVLKRDELSGALDDILGRERTQVEEALKW